MKTSDCKFALKGLGLSDWKRVKKVKSNDGRTLRAFSSGALLAIIDSGPDDSKIGHVWVIPFREVTAEELKAIQLPFQNDDGPDFILDDEWAEYLEDGEKLPTKFSDLVFHVGKGPGMASEDVTVISCCTLDYWKREGCLDDRSFACEAMYKLGYPELCESMYESTESVEETRKKLLAAGLVEDLEFSKFMESE